MPEITNTPTVEDITDVIEESVSNNIREDEDIETCDEDSTFEERLEYHMRKGFDIFRLDKILTNYGYASLPYDEFLLAQLSTDEEHDALTYILKNRYAMILATPTEMAILIPLDQYNVSIVNVNNLGMLDDLVIHIRHTGKKRCEICNEKRTKHFRSCSRCNNSLCHLCFKQITENIYSCPFCRYTLKEHIHDYIYKHELCYDDYVKYNAERI
jgi:hypothetical protein